MPEMSSGMTSSFLDESSKKMHEFTQQGVIGF